MLIVGFVFNPYPASLLSQQISYIPLFLGLILLGVGFFAKKNLAMSRKIKMFGWGVFAFFWALQPMQLYGPSDDLFNGVVCGIGVYFLVYMGYQEWLSLKRNEEVSCLNWIAGGTFLAGIIYFTIDTGIVLQGLQWLVSPIPDLKTWLIEVVAVQSNAVLQLFGLQTHQYGPNIFYKNAQVNIIFACTAIQSMVLFVGMNAAVHKATIKKRFLAIAGTVIPVYLLNLLRNAGVIFLVGEQITSFELAHNVIFKLLSLVALIILLFINFKIVPELFDELFGITNLWKRKGPIENLFSSFLGKKNDAHS